MTRRRVPGEHETLPERRARARRIARALADVYPDAWCALRHDDAWQLLVATILSAQCTDERVNMVTPTLFARYPTAAAMAAAPTSELETLIRSTGFFRQKTKALKTVATAIAARGGEVPRDMDALVALGGVGRKTANVVLGTAYGVPAIMVDTHVRRLANRLGLTREDDPVKIETDLRDRLPAAAWTHFSHRLIHHGRRICSARAPRCPECALLPWCPQIDVPARFATSARARTQR
ncbi:MAG: endonuclease III [Deltaproteobacteria bacterium]|nr:endonuclease III [Deltaproteobacteria bacterium]